MRRDEAIARLKAIEPEIRAFGVRSLHLFGSVARDETSAASDIDIFVEPNSTEFYGLSNYMGAYDRLVATFPGVDIGYSTREGLSKYVRASIEREAIRVF